MAHARVQTRLVEDLLTTPEPRQVVLGGPAVRLVSPREMGPQADDVDLPLVLRGPGLACQRRQVLQHRPRAGHPRIHLDVDPGHDALGTRRGANGLELRERGD